MASADDVIIQLRGIVSQLSNWVSAFNGRAEFGTFTLAAAATTTVTQAAVKPNSVISLTPTNAAAATLQGSSKALYVSSLASGTSFTVATASGASATGLETFQYIIMTPM